MRILASLAAAILLAACVSSIDETSESLESTAPNRAMPLRVFQMNVYPGTNVDDVIAAPDLIVGLGHALQDFVATDWPARADRIAAEIARTEPDVISLNEMVTVSWSNIGLFTFVPPYAPLYADLPDALSMDFLPVLQQALAVRDVHYVLVARQPGTTFTLPIPLPGMPEMPMVSYEDSDVLLVRDDVLAAEVDSNLFAARTTILLGPIPIELVRGYIAADLEVRGRVFRFAATHPESGTGGAALRDLQIAELLGAMEGETKPVVLAGDLNFTPSDPPYAQVQAAGLVDLWTLRVGARLPEWTCCQDDDLANSEPALDSRIDYVWARPPAGYGIGPVTFAIFGDALDDRTSSGLWPSDHAGLLVSLVLRRR